MSRICENLINAQGNTFSVAYTTICQFWLFANHSLKVMYTCFLPLNLCCGRIGRDLTGLKYCHTFRGLPWPLKSILVHLSLH